MGYGLERNEGRENGDREKLVNIVAFWVIATSQLSIRSGLSTAAHDLLAMENQHSELDLQSHTTNPSASINNQSLNDNVVSPTTAAALYTTKTSPPQETGDNLGFSARECNPTSTGSLIAVCYIFNILAAIIIIICCYQMHPLAKIVCMEAFFVTGFLFLSYADTLAPMFVGAILIGVAISLFELTIPPLATMYKVEATNALASGAGIAQVMGSSLYVATKAFNVPAKYTFYPFLLVNVIGIIVFTLLLDFPPPPPTKESDNNLLWSMDRELEILPLLIGGGRPGGIPKPETIETKTYKVPDRSKRCCLLYIGNCPFQWPSSVIPSLCQTNDYRPYESQNVDFMVDLEAAMGEIKQLFVYLILFYLLEYYTNLGLLEHATVNYPNSSSPSIASQYRIYMFSYHAAQSVVRSIPLPKWAENKLAIITLIQSLITATIFSQALFSFIKDMGIVLMIVIVEGIAGSTAYLIGLRQARNCSQNEGVKKAATILVLAADAVALGMGSLAAISSHNFFCNLHPTKYRNIHSIVEANFTTA